MKTKILLLMLLLSAGAFSQKKVPFTFSENNGNKKVLLSKNGVSVTSGGGSNGGVAFSLSERKNTSAGVYKIDADNDTILVRTLWSGEYFNAGTYSILWDGTDDRLQPLPVQNYIVKVLSNNVLYNWDGVFGNTSVAKYGQQIHTSFEIFNKMVIVGNRAFYSTGYNEGNSSVAAFDLDNIQVRQDVYNRFGGWVGSDFIATDNTNIFITALDVYNPANSFVYARAVSDNSFVNYSNGTDYTGTNIYFPGNSVIGLNNEDLTKNFTFSGSKSFNVNEGAFNLGVKKITITGGETLTNQNDFNVVGSTISILKETNIPANANIKIDYYRITPITGIAVNANYIFISRKELNRITVIDKTTGAILQTLTATKPTLLAIDGSSIWVTRNDNTIQKFAIGAGGVLGAGTTTLTGFSSVTDVKVNNSLIAVVDGGTSQQVKTFNTSNGSAAWTLGQPSGINNSPLVTDDKFGFNGRGGIAFASDNSFWVLDEANFRMQHFDANRNLINFIMYLPHTRSCSIVGNDNTHVLGNAIEFEFDYSKPFAQSWKLKYNWLPKLYDYNSENGIMGAAKLSNGRTYAMVYRTTTGRPAIVELDPVNGVRYTNSVISDPNWFGVKMYPNGNIYSISGNGDGETERWLRDSLTGFNSNNDPIYSQSILPVNYPVAALEPKLSGPRPYPYEKTSSNLLILFKGENGIVEDYRSYHLGGMNATTGKLMFRASAATFGSYQGEYPTDGAFDAGNFAGYRGTVGLAIEKNIFTGYNGEFWKASQTSVYNHFYDNGLFIGQFGATGPQYNQNPVLFPSFAGNDYNPQITKVNNNYYLYHTDESVHGGLHRWSISGLNTIKEEIINVPSTFIRSLERPLPSGVIDLMSGLPYRADPLLNNANGWSYTPGTSQFWAIKTSILTYNIRKPHDLDIYYTTYQGQNGGINTVSRNLGNNTNLQAWQIGGRIAYNGEAPNFFDQKGVNAYVDILDNAGKIITRFYFIDNYSHDHTWAKFNNTDVYDLDQGTMQYYAKEFRSLTFTKTGASLNVDYGGHTATVTATFEAGANMGNPTSLRFYFYNGNGENGTKHINIDNFTFSSNTNTLANESSKNLFYNGLVAGPLCFLCK